MPRKRVKLQKEIKEIEERIFHKDIDKNDRKDEVPTIMTIFREILDLHSHDRLLTQLTLDFYEKILIDEFCEDFFECMRHIMIYEDRIKTEIPILFCVKFVISCMKRDMTPTDVSNGVLLLKRMVKFISYYDNSTETNVRFHSVQVARILLTELTDDVSVPDILFEKIQTLLLKRFWDIKSFIRAEAARASSRLQDPNDADCPIVVALMHLSRFDSSHTVRLAAMEALAITTKTLPCIVARSRDLSDIVRKKSFDLMTKWKILKPLTVSKRLQIIESGLSDKSDIVQNACKNLLKVWLIASDNDPVALLKRFDVENKEETTELAFTHLLKSLNSNEVESIFNYLLNIMDECCMIREEYLNAEAAFLWKNLVIFFSDRSDEYGDYLEKILPAVPDFELYLRRLFQKPIDQSIHKEISLDEYAEYCTIIKQLLHIVKYIDIFDSFNRQKIVDLIKWAMSSTDIPFNYVGHLMKLLVHLESNNVKICDETVALINDLLFDSDNIGESIQYTEGDICNQSNHNMEVPLVGSKQKDHINIQKDHTVVNKEALRKKRIEIAELDVKLNELKEMINNCMQAKEFDGVQALVNELKIFESKKTELIAIKEQLMTPTIDKGIHDVIFETFETPPIKMETKEIPQWMTSGMESRIIKANIMTISMIQECNLLWSMPSSLRSLFDNVILVSVRHTDACVRQKAILSMGLCCLLDKELALKYYTIFLKSLEVDHDQIKDVAVKSLIDLFIRFGIEPFQESLITSKENSKMLEQSMHLCNEIVNGVKQESFVSYNTTCSVQLTEEEQNKCLSELINPIIHLLNSDKTELQNTATIGLSKLLYHHKLISSKLLSRLLLLWFNPETENNALLRQHLGGFFTNYTLMSQNNQEAITNSFMITMRTLFRAPASSPLSEVDISNVIEFFLRVTDSKYLLENRIEVNRNDENITTNIKDASQLDNIKFSEELDKLDNPCHNELALTICNQILKAPLSSETKYYVGMLVRLRLSYTNPDVVNNVNSMVMTMINKLKDKKSIQLLEKYYAEVLSKFTAKNSESVTLTELHSTIPETPVNKPLLLEVNTMGQPQENRFFSHTMINVDVTMSDMMSEISSINMDDTLVDQTTIEKDILPSQIEEFTVIDSSISINEGTKQSSKEIEDDNIFKKPQNVRITRSSSRQKQYDISSDSSASSDSIGTKIQNTKKSNMRKS